MSQRTRAGTKKKRSSGQRVPTDARRANEQIDMNAYGPPERLRPTNDPCDRAHNAHDQATGLLLPAEQVQGSPRPRRYDECYLLGLVVIDPETKAVICDNRVSIETGFDLLNLLERELARDGVGPTVRRASPIEDVIGRMRTSVSLRDILEGATKHEGATPAELAMEREASAFLEARGEDPG